MSESKFPVRTLLFVSLAVNLLVIGAVVGVAMSGARLHRGVDGPPGARPAPGAFMGALPRERQHEVRRELGQAWMNSAEERRAAREARRALMNEIDKPEIDEAALRAAFAKVRAADGALAAKNQDAVIGVLKEMEPDERRAAIAAILRAGGGPRGLRGGGRGGEGRRGLGEAPPPVELQEEAPPAP